MKKLLYVFIAVTAIVFASCDRKVTVTVESDGIDTTAVDTIDTLAIDTIAE